MATADFLPFATAPNANVTSQQDWIADPVVPEGFTSGILPSSKANKAIRQSSFVTAGVAEMILQTLNQDVLDDGNLGKFTSQLSSAITTLGSASPNAVQKTGDTMTGPLILNADPVVPLGAATKQYTDLRLGGLAPLASPVFTGIPTAPTAPALTSTGQLATTAFATTGITTAMNSAYALASHNTGRNFVLNPMMTVQQRGLGPWTGGYTADRWIIGTTFDTENYSIITLTNADRAAIGDEDARWALQNTFVGSSANNTSVSYLHTKIENLFRFTNKTMTLSFWARCTSGTLNIGMNFLQNYGTGGSPTTNAWVLPNGSSVTISTTWGRYTITVNMPSIAGATLGTNLDHNLWVALFMSANTGIGPISGIGVQSGTVQFWGVQLELGSSVTPLEKRPYQQELASCQRYYQIMSLNWGGYCLAGAAQPWGTSMPFPVQMRASPTMTIISPSYIQCSSLVVAPLAGSYYMGITATATGMIGGGASVTASAEFP
jgi:hypothetical protein